MKESVFIKKMKEIQSSFKQTKKQDPILKKLRLKKSCNLEKVFDSLETGYRGENLYYLSSENKKGFFGVLSLLENLVYFDEYLNEKDFYSQKTSQVAINEVIGSNFKYFKELAGVSTTKTPSEFLQVISKERKYKKLIEEHTSNMLLLLMNYQTLENTLLLFEIGLNKDIIFNHLKKTLEENKKEGLEKFDRLEKDYVSFSKRKSFFKDLKNKYTEDRICSLSFGIDSGMGFYDLVEEYLKSKKRKLNVMNTLPNQPKDIEEIHDYFFSRIETEEILKQKNYSLNQREDFLKLDNQKIKVQDQTMVVKVPKTKHELAIFSHLFQNCVGRADSYAQSVKSGKSSIVGVFDEMNKPLYCIQTSKYTFIQARGVGNSNIPKDVLFSLESAITMKPELPGDFIPVAHSFIFGYSYNPKTESLFIMFRKNETIYEYENVPSGVYEDFSKVETKGSFLNSVIKKYSCSKAS